MSAASDVELFEARVWAELHTAWAEQMPGSRARVQRFGRATALATPTLDVVAVNRVIGLGLERPLDLTQIGEVGEFYRQSGCTRWFLDWSPEARLEHPRVLEDAGAVLRTESAKLIGDMSELRPVHRQSEIRVERITSHEREIFTTLVGSALGIPEAGQSEIVAAIDGAGWHYYLARIGESPVAGAAMYVNAGGAWFGFTGTREEFRCRGAQTALLTRRIFDARSLECSWVSAETFPPSPANPSLRNMTRLGMRVLYNRSVYRIDVA
jgi:hypothetical protein